MLVFTVVETDDAGWTSARSLLGFAAAIALAGLFALSERHAASPLLPPELLRRRRAMSANGVVFIAAGGLLAMFFFQTLYMQRVLGFGALETGLAFLPFSAAMGLATGIVSKLPQALDPRVPVAAGLALTAAGLWMMAGLDPASAYAGDVLPTLIVTGLGLGVAFVPVMGLATGDAEERDGGLASGLMTSAQQIGGAIGIAVMVTIATSQGEQSLAAGSPPPIALTDGFAAAFEVQAIVMLAAAAIAVVVLGGRRRATYPEPTAASLS